MNKNKIGKGRFILAGVFIILSIVCLVRFFVVL